MASSAFATTVLPPNNSGTTRMLTSTATITLPSLALSFQDNAPWTIELWCSFDALTDGVSLFGKEGEFSLGSNGAQLNAALAGQTVPLQSTDLLKTKRPVCIVVLYDGLTMSLLLDGALAVQATTSASPTATGNPLVIGGNFYGEIQGLRLWSQAMNTNILGSFQFEDFKPNEPYLLTQLDFTTSPPADTSGQGVQPTLGSNAVYEPFVPAAVLKTTSFCDPYNDDLVNPAGQQTSFSVTAWVCPTLNALMYVFTNGVAESDSGMILAVNADGNVVFQVGNSAVLTSQGTVTDGEWVYLAATWASGTGTGTLYINGTLDSSGTGMTLAGSLAAGEPLIGAIASEGAQLPISSFEGQIQSVTVWNEALNDTQILTYQTASPQTAANCVAFYDLSQAPAQNQISFNPVGLVAGAAQHLALVSDLDGAVRIPARALSAAATFTPPSADAAYLGAAEQEFARLLNAFTLTDDQKDFFSRLHTENARRGQQDLAAGRLPDILRMRIDALPNGGSQVTYVHPDGTEEVILVSELSDCTMWCIQLVVAIVGALITAFGFTLNYKNFLNGMTTFLGTRINTIGIMPQLAALLRSGVSAQNIYQALKLLHEYSLLVPLAKASYECLKASLSWWTIVSVGMRILLLMSPSAPLEILWLIAQLAYSVYTIAQLLNNCPENCPT